jgi:hypothetical protein
VPDQLASAGRQRRPVLRVSLCLGSAAADGQRCSGLGNFDWRELEHLLNITGRMDGVSGRPAEYEAATAGWLEQTVDFLMVASDRLYAQLRPEQIDGLAETVVRSGAGGELLVTQVHLTATGSIDVGSVIAGDLKDLEIAVADIAYQKLEQTMRAYFALIMDVTHQTGNVVEANGDAAEALLAMLEKMDIAFDADGSPAIQMVVSPADAGRIRAQLAALTPEQHRRFAEIIIRKREVYRATRRRRRLPRHCH